ncbi:MAG TPA: MltA domain-containing protein [Xanthobacteraceae bacterium]|nr:MltA domain-containing protein [Xanthobacteraceae bacterium]
MAARQRRMRSLGITAALILGAGAAAAEPARGPLRLPDAALEPVAFADLDGWAADDHAKAFAAFRASCAPLVRSRAPDERPLAAALVAVCRHALALTHIDEAQARDFFQANFRPLRISRLGDPQGFVTGYYEPIVEGSRFPTREFTVPLYRRPDDLVAPGEHKGEAFPNRGPAFRRTHDGKLVPYYDRGEIEDGALDGRHLEICWLRDAFTALTIQIQGSARVRLEDGLIMRVNYAAHNGQPYTPIGRILIERNLVPREEMSLDRIRQWMRDNPDQTKELRRKNQGFVFFRVTGLADDSEPAGSEGVRLMAGRSIAVDRPLHAYGTPFFIEADLPLDGPAAKTPWRRLTVAQDTGSAIVGPARADIYFGAGDDAGRVAGRVRQPARLAMLVPRALDPVEAGAHMPLPPPKPVRIAAKSQEKSTGKGARLRHRTRWHMRGQW